MTTFSTSIIIEEFNIKDNNGIETPFEWSYTYDNNDSLVKTKELKMLPLRMIDVEEFRKRSSSLEQLNFLALKGYISPTQPLGNNPTVNFNNTPMLLAVKLLEVYNEYFLEYSSLELKIKKQ